MDKYKKRKKEIKMAETKENTKTHKTFFDDITGFLSKHKYFIIIILILIGICIYLFNNNNISCNKGPCSFEKPEQDLISQTTSHDYTNNFDYALEPENESKIISIKDNESEKILEIPQPIEETKSEGKVESEQESVELTNEDLHEQEIIEYYKSGPRKGQPKKSKGTRRITKKK